MKKICIGLFGLVGSIAFASEGPAFDSSLPQFQINHREIVWAAPTNQSRAVLWVYKVVPQNFPFAAISNLEAMGSFTNKIADSKGPIYLVNGSNTCNLIVKPAQGWVEYHDGFAPANHWDRTNHLWERAAGVPNDAKVEKLGLKLLEQFGINRAELAQTANGHLVTFGEKRTRGYFDRRRGKDIDGEITALGIFFTRRIDKVNFAGIGLGGGCEILYGNHAKLADFKLEWRDLQPYAQHKVANQDEIMQWIAEGKAVMTHKNVVNPGDVTKVTITDCSPLYMGADNAVAQNLVYPFAKIEAVADIGPTNVAIELYCPIIEETSP